MAKENREDSDRKYREVHKKEIDAKRKIYNITENEINKLNSAIRYLIEFENGQREVDLRQPPP